MASGIDKIIGLVMLFVASFVFIYYTLWVMLMPFVDQGHPLHDFFPAREWAIRAPVLLLLLGGTLVGSFLGFVMVKSARKKATKSKAK